MANQFASTNALNGALGILKNWYAGPIVSQFNDEIPFYREVEKGKEKFSGLQVVRSVKVRRNPGIGATSDGGVLPSIGQQTTQQAQIAAKFNYLRFGITGPLIKSAQGDKGAFVSAMEFEMSEGLTDLKQDVNRQLFWSGNSTLATVSAAATASNVITVTGRESAEDGNKFLDVGVIIDIVSGGVVTASGLSITAISGTTTATLTLSNAVTCSANDLVIRSGSLNNEVSGVLYTLDGGTSTIYNIDRSAYPTYQGNVLDNGANSLSLNFLKQGWNQGKRRGNAKYDAVYCDFDSERFYERLLIVDKRYMGKVKGDGTFASKDENYLEYGGIPIVPDKDSPQRFLFLDSKQWKKYVLSELEWADETGTYLIAQTSADAFEARLRLFFNMFCEKPSAQVALKNYTSP
jgi:hypothetical protein